MLIHAESAGNQDLNPERSDSGKREGWADQAPGIPAVVSISPLFSSFPGAGLLGAFGPGEFTGRRASRGRSGHARGWPWDQTAKRKYGKRSNGCRGVACSTPTHPSLFSLPIGIHFLFPAPLCLGEVQTCPLPCWSSGNRPGLKETPGRAGEEQGL